MGKWFLCHNENVSGPFDEEEIRKRFENHQVPAESLIWGHGASEWRPFANWEKGLSSNVRPQSFVDGGQLWHFAVGGVSKGPLNRKELLFELKNVHDKGEILVWTKGMKAWADLYEFHDLIEELGLNRREHPRVKASGHVTVKTDNGTVMGDLNMIGPGGFGAHRFPKNIAIGEVVTVELAIDGLNDKISSRAVVQYLTDSGYHGFKFESLSMEARSRVTDYVRSGVPTGRAA